MHSLSGSHSVHAETCKGVRVNVTSVAQVKVHARHLESLDTRGVPKVDIPSILLAAQHFLGEGEADIADALRKTMEGYQRQILGTLTAEELFKDRAAFSSKIREHVTSDLKDMGYQVVSYTVVAISDDSGYMESLGETQTAAVKREAAEGRARNEAEGMKKVSEYEAGARIAAANYNREAIVATNLQKEQEAESDHNLKLKEAAYDRKVFEARAEADASLLIEEARQQKSVVHEKEMQKEAQKKAEKATAIQEAERVQIQEEGRAQAKLMAAMKDVEAVTVRAGAQAEEIRLLGIAEAERVKAVGEAEAEVLRAKAEAYKQYGEAAMMEMMIEKMPAIADAIAKPLEQTKNLTFVSNDGTGPSQLTGDIAKMVSQVPEVVNSLTGFDMKKAMSRQADGTTNKATIL